jgi:hypothetical protein
MMPLWKALFKIKFFKSASDHGRRRHVNADTRAFNKSQEAQGVLPYLRYGLIAGRLENVPGRFSIHIEALEFCGGEIKYKSTRLHRPFANLLTNEI